MLHFERQNKSGKILLSVKQRTKLWTFDFTLALGIALLIHVVGFLFFRVDLKGFLNPTKYPSTVFVSSEQVGSTLGFYEQENIPEIPSFLIIQQLETPPLSLISLAANLKPKPLPIDLSGLEIASIYKPVTSRFFLSGGCQFLIEPEPIKAKKISKAKLEFQANSETGIIFWLNWLEATGDPKCDLRIVENLKNSKLIASHSLLAMRGIIEVEFGL